MAQEPDPLFPEPTEEARKWYFRSYKKQRRGKEPGVPPPAPWYGVDPNAGAQDDEVHTFVHGPPNYPQVWTDYRAQGGPIQRPDPQHNTSPLGPILPKEMKWIRENEPDLSNIIFERKLADGGFSKVWRVEATLRGTRKLMACKVISLTHDNWDHLEWQTPIQDQQTELVKLIDTMLADYTALKQFKVNHVNLCNIEKLVAIPNQQTGFPYNTVLLFEELCHGDLFQILEYRHPNPMSEAENRHWFRQVASGLAFLHSHKISHCDLKPENIFFVNPQAVHPAHAANVFDMTFKLGDLGLAIIYPDFPGQPTMSHTYRGTLDFMAPEMAQSYGPPPFVDTAKADVYSLGMTLVLSLIGDNEFTYRSQYGTLDQDMRDVMQGQGNLNVSMHAASLVVQMITPNVHARITAEQALNHMWIRSNSNNPTPITPPTPPPLAPTPSTATTGVIATPATRGATIPFYYYPLMIGIAVGLTFLARRFFRR